MMFAPTRYTPTLRDDFVSDVDQYLPYIQAWWSMASPGFVFDEWQIELLRRMTEVDDKGDLRFRSVLVSMGRQNGKSELVSALGVWSLLRKEGAYNVSVASTAEQARLVYDRVQRIVAANPTTLGRLMVKLTDTRGMKTKHGAKYEIKASNSSVLQGIPVHTGIVDECHLVGAGVWDALLSGTGARDNTIIIGITTAGDENSELLNRLYQNANKAISGDDQFSRFGAWIWEASESEVPEDDEKLIELLKEANPALQSGRIDVKNLLDDVRALPKDDIVRYRLNRFVNSGDKTFIPLDLWWKCTKSLDYEFPQGDVVFAIDRTPDWGHASVAAAVKTSDDVIHTELVASIVKPTMEQLLYICGQLANYNPKSILVDGYTLRDLHKELKLRGFQADTVTLSDIVNASSLFYSRIARRTLVHAGDALMTVQVPRTVRKLVGEGFRVSRRDSAVEIDSVMATLLATYGAETLRPTPIQVF
jgi:phage terminase large subunit-like protein